MSRERLNYHILLDRAGTGPDRTDRLEALLSEERAALRASASDTWDAHVATANIETLEKTIAQSKRNDDARAEIDAGIAARKQAEAAKAEERRAALAEAERAEIKRQYLASNRAATEAEFEAAFPRLLERHREAQMDAGAAKARAAMRPKL